jgi:ABC-type Na+ transport system ATPase subunit NatA
MKVMKQTAVEFLMEKLFYPSTTVQEKIQWFEQAKEMEKEQIGYTKEDVLKAGEMGEINHHDTKHIVSYLDEAKHYNETFNNKEK